MRIRREIKRLTVKNEWGEEVFCIEAIKGANKVEKFVITDLKNLSFSFDLNEFEICNLKKCLDILIEDDKQI